MYVIMDAMCIWMNSGCIVFLIFKNLVLTGNINMLVTGNTLPMMGKTTMHVTSNTLPVMGRLPVTSNQLPVTVYL
jgi:hypothetical protein